MGTERECFVCGIGLGTGGGVEGQARTEAPAWMRVVLCVMCSVRVKAVGQALIYQNEDWHTVRVLDPGEKGQPAP